WKIATYVSFVVIVGLLTFNIIGSSKHLRAGDIQSLLIFPFDNLTGDDQLDYVAGGMHAALIGDMGQISALGVISKTTASVFKTKNMSLSQIAKEINMEAVVEPSLMSYGDDSVCVQIRVITMYPKEKQLWVAEYKEEKSQILILFNQITKQIAKEMMVELSTDEKRRLDKMRTVDKEAYDAYLSSYEYWGDLSKESLDKAYEYLSQAIEKDPEWAPLYAGMAQVWVGRLQMGMVETTLGRQRLHENINKAFELDPDFPDSHFINGIISTWTDWNWEQGEKSFLKALAINPNDVMSRIYYSHLLSILQRPDEAQTHGKLAVELDPLNPLILGLYSAVLRHNGQFQKALEYAEKALAINPEHSFSISQLKQTLLSLEEYDKAFEYRKIDLAKFFGEELIQSFDLIFREEGYIAAEKEIVRQFELLAQERYVSPNVMASRHYSNKEYSKALDDLEKCYELHEPNMPYIAGFVELHDSTRFIAIMKKMNLPFPGK
ncbi:MAG: tetratricopeptide repeat protein, partial [Bacteroidales bacterium]|nr:tetratricopeptide repeat protein [Bacteroidales bacterium]